MLWLELFGFVTGVANVWLLARRSIWNWPVALVNNFAYLAVFLGSGLYGDAGLQLVYAAFGAYGWMTWAKEKADAPVRRLTASGAGTGALATLAAYAALAWFLARYTDSDVPRADALTTALSLTATALQGRRILECWLWWIAADLIYVPLYLYKQLHWTAALYAVFLALCVMGLRSWRDETSVAKGD